MTSTLIPKLWPRHQAAVGMDFYLGDQTSSQEEGVVREPELRGCNDGVSLQKGSWETKNKLPRRVGKLGELGCEQEMRIQTPR